MKPGSNWSLGTVGYYRDIILFLCFDNWIRKRDFFVVPMCIETLWTLAIVTTCLSPAIAKSQYRTDVRRGVKLTKQHHTSSMTIKASPNGFIEAKEVRLLLYSWWWKWRPVESVETSENLDFCCVKSRWLMPIATSMRSAIVVAGI